MVLTPLERLRGHLDNVRPNGDGFTSRCPAHDDRRNSLSISEGDDGRVLLKCFAGCRVEQIVAAIGLRVQDLFPTTQSLSDHGTCAVHHVTVQDLAKDKQLPAEFLRSLGLEDRPDGVLVPYTNPDGSRASRNRLRTALRAGEGSIWMFGKGKLVAYGLDRLEAVREAQYLVLVEGESDCWTLWHHGFPAIGIPGASMAKVIEAEHLGGIPRVFVCQEPDKGGETFVSGVANQLRRLGWRGEPLVFSLGDHKDANELHKRDSDSFEAAFQKALDQAEPLQLPEIGIHESASRTVDQVLVASGVATLDQGTTATDLDRALRQLADELSGADKIRRMTVREAAIGHLKSIGLSAPAKLVDAALGSTAEADAACQESQALLSSPDPWPECVDGTELLDRLVECLVKYVILPEGAAEAIALWIVHSYCLDCLHLTPILAIVSPVKRCGKTTLLTVIASLVTRLLLASNITPAAVFRTIDKFKPTLLIDEADTFIAKNDELRGVINAGHTRVTAQVIRSEGDNHEPRVFSTWSAKGIALIGRLRDTIEDRSILITLRRRRPAEKVGRLRGAEVFGLHEPLRQMAARWAADHAVDVGRSRPTAVSGLNDRAVDNWEPLLAIADIAGGDWPERARRSARLVGGQSDEAASSRAEQLLHDLRDLYFERSAAALTSEEIVKALTSMEHRPWPEYRHEKPLSKNQLAALLRPFGVAPGQFRDDRGDKGRGYKLEDLQDVFDRYLPPETVQPVQTGESLDSGANPVPDVESPETVQAGTFDDPGHPLYRIDPVRTGSCTDPDTPKVPNVPAVPDRTPEPAGTPRSTETDEFEL